ncbi:hypothetical protein B0T13DRAFT_135482 [Neurospora crassa]|nr:hypothetical protein B0T13DRAFT_135482 [Neurospora crassa]
MGKKKDSTQKNTRTFFFFFFLFTSKVATQTELMSSETGARKAVWSRTFLLQKSLRSGPVLLPRSISGGVAEVRIETTVLVQYGESMKQMPYSESDCYPPDEAVSLSCFVAAKVSCCCAVPPDKPTLNPGRCKLPLAAACVGPVDYICL